MMSGLPVECLHALKYLNPSYHMSPFDTRYLQENLNWQKGPEMAPGDFRKDLGEGDFFYSHNGREAIHWALKDLNLQSEDEIWILTSSGGPYISGCVTGEVQKFCQWSLEQTAKTKAVFVIHDFGIRNPSMEKAYQAGLPVIEDCAYALGTCEVNGKPLGARADYAIYSFSKAFPLQFGGLLRARRDLSHKPESTLSAEGLSFLKKSLSHYWPQRQAAFAKRKELFGQFARSLAEAGFQPKYKISDDLTVPYAFVVEMKDQRIAEKMRPLVNEAGIESSVYFGCGGYFLPLHQGLNPSDVAYICSNFIRIYKDIVS